MMLISKLPLWTSGVQSQWRPPERPPETCHNCYMNSEKAVMFINFLLSITG